MVETFIESHFSIHYGRDFRPTQHRTKNAVLISSTGVLTRATRAEAARDGSGGGGGMCWAASHPGCAAHRPPAAAAAPAAPDRRSLALSRRCRARCCERAGRAVRQRALLAACSPLGPSGGTGACWRADHAAHARARSSSCQQQPEAAARRVSLRGPLGGILHATRRRSVAWRGARACCVGWAMRHGCAPRLT